MQGGEREEPCLFGVGVADMLEAGAVVDEVGVGRQVVLTEGTLARLAGKQQPARLAGRAPALPAVVVRAHPPLRRLQLLHTPARISKSGLTTVKMRTRVFGHHAGSRARHWIGSQQL